MNYATLVIYRLSDNSDRLSIVQYLKKQLGDYRKNGLNSVLYYYNIDTHKFRVLSIWSSKAQYQNLPPGYLPQTISLSFAEAQLTETAAYQMLWEMQRSHLQNVSSGLQEMEISKGIDFQVALKLIRQLVREKVFSYAETATLWLGQNQDEPQKLLCRTDWANKTSIVTFRQTTQFKDVIEELAQNGISITYVGDEITEDFTSGGNNYNRLNTEV